uniref:Peptidase S1 domain-containing protein n=1 Tax=Panagrolaimus sp. ES5 TaxID=591445 RepID=A0AC34FH85_9BILA
MRIILNVIFCTWIFDSAFADECGISPSLERYAVYNPNRVISGEYSKDGDWPWIVAILTNVQSNEIGMCTGTIVDKEWILTAAHCATIVKSNINFVLSGSVDTSKAQKNVVIESFVHPHFNRNVTNDIALMKLSKPLEFNENVSPICLDKNVKTDKGEIYVGAGFGNVLKQIFTNETQLDLSEPGIIEYEKDSHRFLRESPMANIGECELEIPEVSNRTICVGGINTGPLEGDSGGPLMVIKNGKWIQIGVTSLGGLLNVDPLSAESRGKN